MKQLDWKITFKSFLISTAMFSLSLSSVADNTPKLNAHSNTKNTEIFTTVQSIKINNDTIKYKTYAGTIPIYDEFYRTDKKLADMSYIAYVKNEPNKDRPISFIFNGGPAASSVYLNFYGTGPEIFRMEIPGNSKSSKKEPVITNDNTWLKFTDEVYIDAPGTGFGTLSDNDNLGSIAGVKQDAGCFAKFIYSFLKKYNRFDSPFFIVGESYGGIRTPYLISYLFEKYKLQPSGVVLIAPLLSFFAIPELGTVGNNLPFAASIPTYAATAYYHKKLDNKLMSREVVNIVKEVEKWSMGIYLSSLNNEQKLTNKNKEEIAEKLSLYTGLKKELILNYNLKIPTPVFAQELIKGSCLSRYDTRYYQYLSYWHKPTGTDPFENDAEWVGTQAVYSYLQNILKINTPVQYKINNKKINGNWQWFNTDSPMKSLESLPELYNIMVQIPDMKVFVTNGYYELGFPYYTATYLLEQLNLPKALKNNLTHKVYWSGHMMYSDPKIRQKLYEDVSIFYKQ